MRHIYDPPKSPLKRGTLKVAFAGWVKRSGTQQIPKVTISFASCLGPKIGIFKSLKRLLRTIAKAIVNFFFVTTATVICLVS